MSEVGKEISLHFLLDPAFNVTLPFHFTSAQFSNLLALFPLIFFFFAYNFIYFWLYWVFVAAHGLSPVAASRALLFAMHELLIAVASFVAEHGLWSTGSVVVVHGLSCSLASGIFPDQGLNPFPSH